MPSWRHLLATGIWAFPLAQYANAAAHEPYVYASTVSYCSPPSELLIDRFDVAFFKQNHSVVFNIVAEATKSLNLSGRAIVNAYALTPVDLNFNLCDLSSFFCPIPAYTFNGSATIPIPTSFASRIPSIAYIIPDLEAYIQLTLTDNNSHEVVACIQATASNGLSTQMGVVEWVTGYIAIGLGALVALMLVLSIWSGVWTANTDADHQGTGLVEKQKQQPIPTPESEPRATLEESAYSDDDHGTRIPSAGNSMYLLSPSPPPGPSVRPAIGTSLSVLEPANTATPTPLLSQSSLTPRIANMQTSTPSTSTLLLTTTTRRFQFILTQYILFIQHIILTSFLHLNYPMAYASFVLNFSWAFGLFGFGKPARGGDGSGISTGGGSESTATKNSTGIQHAIDRMRSLTGAGSYAPSSPSSDIGKWNALDPSLYGQRTFSPYNEVVHSSSASSTDSGSGLGGLFFSSPAQRSASESNLDSVVLPALDPSLSSSFSVSPPSERSTLSLPPTPYVMTSQMLEPGLESYVNALGIPTGNAAMSVWFSAVILCAGFAVLVLIGFAAVSGWSLWAGNRRRREMRGRKRPNLALPPSLSAISFLEPPSRDSSDVDVHGQDSGHRTRAMNVYTSHIRHTVLTVLFPVLALPVTTLSYYQWTIKHDAWLPDFLCAVLVIALWGTLFGVGVSSFIGARRRREQQQSSGDASALDLDPSDPETSSPNQGRLPWSIHYLPTSIMASITLPSLFVKSFFVGFGQSSGWAQVTGLLAVEVLVFIATIVFIVLDRRRRHLLSGTKPRRCCCSCSFSCSSRSHSNHPAVPSSPENHVLLIILSILRLLSTGILIAFEQSLTTGVSFPIKPIPRVVIGIVAIVVNSVGVVLIVLVVAWSILWAAGKLGVALAQSWSRRRATRQGERDSQLPPAAEKTV